MSIARHIIEMLLNPFFLCLSLFAFFLASLWWYGNRLIIRCGLLLTLLLFLLFSTGWMPALITHQFENRYPAVMAVNPQIAWVVVLSGGQAELKNLPANSLLYSPSIKRLLEGLRLYRQLPGSKLLLSGGGYGFKVPEAISLAEVASTLAVPKNDIVLETSSINTADQAKALKYLIGDAPFYLVTSAIHMSRSMALCHAQGLHPLAAPTDFTLFWSDERWGKTYIPNPYNLYYLSIAMHEILGTAWANLYNLLN